LHRLSPESRTLQQFVESGVDSGQYSFAVIDSITAISLSSSGIRLSSPDSGALSDDYSTRATVGYSKVVADLRDFEAQRSRKSPTV
jgi:hypothetical protein